MDQRLRHIRPHTIGRSATQLPPLSFPLPCPIPTPSRHSYHTYLCSCAVPSIPIHTLVVEGGPRHYFCLGLDHHAAPGETFFFSRRSVVLHTSHHKRAATLTLWPLLFLLQVIFHEYAKLSLRRAHVSTFREHANDATQQQAGSCPYHSICLHFVALERRRWSFSHFAMTVAASLMLGPFLSCVTRPA